MINLELRGQLPKTDPSGPAASNSHWLFHQRPKLNRTQEPGTCRKRIDRAKFEKRMLTLDIGSVFNFVESQIFDTIERSVALHTTTENLEGSGEGSITGPFILLKFAPTLRW